MLGLGGLGCGYDPQEISGSDPDSAFRAVIVPVLRHECSGCHFPGGPMYHDLPFDDRATVEGLGDEVMVQLEGKGRERVRRWLEMVRRHPAPPDSAF